ncbi:phospholipase D-like domain-containing protein [Cytobacillus horneckiae]|uniref:Phosphatidylserine/phosphatidylglycerophosphate/ cardiolipin synthase family protein n=1 Tax=Cytobacillus horneckiae TaxID=549687 RepID=A0A2N0ZC14_9BACI|nr:phosphatidylserine/phosphatidylglycerophosphate/cardiolipin synthase family protein [Cytobacillus horneckiae]PKG27071.1 phosphatidylserine/phosphatidylglycerophosphate/cardiolipin synthase family protein [Cytobacillus horneckiae]
MRAKLLKIPLAILFLYFIFILIATTLLIKSPVKNEVNLNQIPSYAIKEQHFDQAQLLEDGFTSGQARLKIIEEAKKTIHIAYYKFYEEETTDLMIGAMFKAADRGVNVRFMLDAMTNYLNRDLKRALAAHPNIELKVYEPFQPLRPGTWQNRLHDKLLIVDEQFVITGGRNLGDKYLAESKMDNFVLDRDVLLYRPNIEDSSVIQHIDQYFLTLWDSPFSKQYKPKLSENDKTKEPKREYMTYYDEMNTFQTVFSNPEFDWDKYTIKVDQTRFLANPIERGKKEPIIFTGLNELFKQAQSSIQIQTPYVIPTKEMKSHTAILPNSEVETDIITNSLNSTPNMLAFSGYLNKKGELIKEANRVYEYEGAFSVHGKSILIDDYTSVIGSFNFDSRSTFINTESIVIIEGKEFAEMLQLAFDDIIKESHLVSENGIMKQPAPTKSAGKELFLNILSKLTVPIQSLL